MRRTDRGRPVEVEISARRRKGDPQGADPKSAAYSAYPLQLSRALRRFVACAWGPRSRTLYPRLPVPPRYEIL